MTRTTRRSAVLGVLASPLIVRGRATAQEAWPTRPVRLIVPFPPGNATDIFARMIGEALSEKWPHRVFVENRAGGASVIGLEAGMRSPPDGYTLIMGTSGPLAVNPTVMPQLPYDVDRDFAPITNIFTLPLIIVASEASGIDTVQALVRFARERPGEATFASTGPATAAHLTGELFAQRVGVQMTHVPYRGSGPALADLLGGNVKLMVDSLASALPHILAGRTRALAVTSRERVPQLPDTPTVHETVSPGYEAIGWGGMVAPAATPPAIVRQVNADVTAILRAPATAERMQGLGGFPAPMAPEEFRAFIRAETKKWGDVARAANVRLGG
jgi:tripartite-type tricarboxylate transporter receptor subunit TctC